VADFHFSNTSRFSTQLAIIILGKLYIRWRYWQNLAKRSWDGMVCKIL